MKQHNILITSAGKRVVLTRAFKDTLAKYDSKAKVYTTDMNPEMAPADMFRMNVYRYQDVQLIIM